MSSAEQEAGDATPQVTEWGSGPRVVLVHGGSPFGGTAAFAPQQALESSWHLVLPDRPGHGQSPRQGQEDFERDANLLGPLLEDGAHLVGQSYGGIVALCMAVDRPEAVRSLTLIEPPAYCFATDDSDAVEMARANRELFENTDLDPVTTMRTFFALVGIDMDLPDPAPEPFVPIAEAFAEDLRNIRGPDEAQIDPQALVAGAYPMQVLTSGRTLGFEAIARAFGQLTGARHVVVQDTDHVMANAGAAVNTILETFWHEADAVRKRRST